jgi:cytoskeletal protein CcmA (bactofilin family)
MKNLQKSLSIIALLAIMLGFATPAYAFDGRSGEDLVIAEDEVIEDDLYVGANSLVLDGTVKGDLVVGARTVTINGTVEGDLIVGAQSVVINGTVADDARVFTAAVQVGPKAQIGGDLVAMGASIEVKKGGSLAQDLVAGGGQVLLAGDVGRNVIAGTNSFEVRGQVGGDVAAYVNVTEKTSTQPVNMYMSDIPFTIPSVKPGLTLADGAQIGGNLDYSSSIELSIPAGIVAGRINRIDVTEEVERGWVEAQPTQGELVAQWAFGMVRSMVTLVLFGLLLIWLFPRFMQLLPASLKSEPLASLGWGALLYAAVFFSILAIVLVTIFLAVVGLRWNIFWLATAYVTKIIVGDAIGTWILSRTRPALAEHPVWPMIVGVVVIVLAIGLLSFPLLPVGFFGWFLNFVIILFGLGTLWMWGRNLWSTRRAIAAIPPAS